MKYTLVLFMICFGIAYFFSGNQSVHAASVTEQCRIACEQDYTKISQARVNECIANNCGSDDATATKYLNSTGRGTTSAKTGTTDKTGTTGTDATSGTTSMDTSIPGESTGGSSLVPCGRSGGQMCTLCDLFVGIQGIMKYGLRILVIITLTMLVVGAVMYIVSAGDSGMITTAKGVMKNALIGTVLVVSAWLIINTVMRVISANTDLGVGATSWDTFSCTAKK